MADYDCFNNGFRPEDVDSNEMTIYEPPHVPCLVSGTSAEYERVIQIFMNFNTNMYKDWLKAHSRGGMAVSDMLILANHSDQLRGKSCVAHWDPNGANDAKAIHFCNACCGGKKIEAIQSWLKTQRT